MSSPQQSSGNLRLPTGWRVVPFEQAFVDATGGNPKVKQSDYLPEGKYPVIDQGQSPIAGYVNDERLCCGVKLPVILFGDHTKIFKYASEMFVLGADGVKVLSPSSDIDPRFGFHYLNTIRLPENAGYSRHFKFLKEATVPLPPLPEQHRIAAILDKADAVRRKRQESIRLTEEFLRSVFLDMFGDPVTNPKGWKLKPLGRVTLIDSTMVDPRQKEFENLLHIGPDRIEKETGRLLAAKTAKEDGLISGKFLFDERYVLYSKIRPLLKKVALPGFVGLCSADVYPVRPVEQLMTREFLWAVLLSDSFTNYTQTLASRANIPKINRKEFCEYPCFLPPITLQKEFSSRLQSIKKLEQNYVVHNEGSELLFKSLVQKGFRGEI